MKVLLQKAWRRSAHPFGSAPLFAFVQERLVGTTKLKPAKSEIRNPKSATNPKFEFKMFKTAAASQFWTLWFFLRFEFVSDFGFRVSDFWRKRLVVQSRCAPFVLAVALTLSLPARAAEATKTFATPDEAAAYLMAAAKSQDVNALRAIFGAALEDIENPDRVQATNEVAAFSAALEEHLHLAHETKTKCVLEAGANAWPFPIPIVQRDGRWFFDTAAGKEELLNRRIGRNELAVLEVMRAYVDAQREYASRDRDGDEVLEYAQRLASTPGAKDGLYWPPELDGEISPLGPFVAHAQAQGYFGDTPIDKHSPQPFHGYLFKILTRQGKHAPGGKYDYVINGNMIGGFALVAWPAEYGESGVMTFIVNQQGRVYQKDLGASTSKVARKMSAYDPDNSWRISTD